MCGGLAAGDEVSHWAATTFVLVVLACFKAPYQPNTTRPLKVPNQPQASRGGGAIASLRLWRARVGGDN